MAVRIGGREIGAVYAAALQAGKDPVAELKRFRAAIVEHSHEEPEIGDFNLWPVGGRVNMPEDEVFPMGDM